MTAIRHVLEIVADGRLVVSRETVDGLEVALDLALGAYAKATGGEAAAEEARIA